MNQMNLKKELQIKGKNYLKAMRKAINKLMRLNPKKMIQKKKKILLKEFLIEKQALELLNFFLYVNLKRKQNIMKKIIFHQEI